MVDWQEDINFDWLKGGSDERNRLIENMPVISMFVFMMLIFIPQIPAQIKPYLIFGGFGCAMIVGVLSEWTLKVKASEFQVYKAVIRPTNKTHYLFMEKPHEQLESKCIDPKNKIYDTMLDLAESEIFDEEKGPSSRVKIRHQLPFTERIMLLPGYVTYKGYPGLAHNSMANIVLWEPKDEKGELDPDNMEWIPHFWLAEAPRDWIIMTEPSEFPNGNNGHDHDIEVIIPNSVENEKDVGKLRQLVIEEQEKSKYWYNTAMQLKQQIVRTKSLARDAVNTSFAAFSRVRDQGKLILEELVACLHAHADIEEGAREYKPFSWPKFGMAAAITIVSLAFLALMAINPEFRATISGNLGLIALIVGGAVVLVYFLKGRVKL